MVHSCHETITHYLTGLAGLLRLLDERLSAIEHIDAYDIPDLEIRRVRNRDRSLSGTIVTTFRTMGTEVRSCVTKWSTPPRWVVSGDGSVAG